LTVCCRRETAGETNQQEKMKKIITLSLAVIIFSIIAPIQGNSKPIFLKFKLGIFAKWSINFTGTCDDGWGLCLTTNTESGSGTTYIGFDKETDRFYLKISDKYPDIGHFSNESYELKEDSQIDPKLLALIKEFQPKGKFVFLKKGRYKVVREESFLIIGFNYYQK
jgi:hypothetical protein